jgi:serine phosphatase RsbU (regulator of sigma subunit)
MLLRDGSAAFVTPYAAPPLGLLDLAEGWCRASMIPVGDGDQLLLYTDGVSEARDAAGRFFPLAQVTAEAAGRGGDGLLDALVTGLEEHVGGRGCDDILLLLVTMRLSAGA